MINWFKRKVNQKYSKDKVYSADTIFVGNYFHWMTEVLPMYLFGSNREDG